MNHTTVARKTANTEQDALQRMLEVGLIKEIRKPIPPGQEREEHEPIPLESRRGSKLIIEERR